MSIYATLWEIQVEEPGPSVIFVPPGGVCPEPSWVTVFAQGVPPHIGQPSEGYTVDPYADFLPPPVVPYDPDDEDMPYRAVVIVQEGRDRKDGQRYVDPILMLTGREYREAPFPELLGRIMEGIRGGLPDE